MNSNMYSELRHLVRTGARRLYGDPFGTLSAMAVVASGMELRTRHSELPRSLLLVRWPRRGRT